MALIFSKPSTRTRVSFEVGIVELGAHPMFLSAAGPTGLQVDRGESAHDTAKVMSRYADAIIIRTFAQQEVEALAEHGSIPVVNALTDKYHPCQALADVMTMRERFGDERGLKLAFVGPGNNVTHSLLLAGPRAGFDVVCACPPGLMPDEDVLERARADATRAGTSVVVDSNPLRAVAGAHVVYTDTWVSMGQEGAAAKLKAELSEYTVTTDMMAAAHPDAVFMHCLPAHRRLHTQKALLLLLLEAEPWS
jgi:ornithine carbamoyltransferase